MVLSQAQLYGWLEQFFWPFFRITGLLMVMPVIGTNLTPIRVRLVLALFLSMIMATMSLDVPSLNQPVIALFLLVAKEIFIGVGFALVIQVVFQAFVTGGQIIAMQMGLGFAAMNDPSNALSVPVISQVYLIMVTLLFLASNGHLTAIEVLYHSFQVMPINEWEFIFNIHELLRWSSWIFVGGLLIVIPAMFSILIVNFAFGIMTRAAPQLTIFSIGFPLTLCLGVVIMLITLPGVLPHFNNLSQKAIEKMHLIGNF